MSIPKAILKQDISGVISDWGVSGAISRFSGSLNAAGKMSGAFVSVATEVFWIQPYDRRRTRGSTRDGFGLLDETSYECFWRVDGYEMQPEDRITIAGQTYKYDIQSDDRPENYRHAWIKLTTRA